MNDAGNAGPTEPSRLTVREAEAVTAALADATAAGLPLADALRAAADEGPGGRVAGELRWLAAQVERGRSIDEIMAAQPSAFPGYVAGLIQAGLRTGRLGQVLVDLMDHQQTVRDMWFSIRTALAYPALLLLLAGGLGLAVELVLLEPIADIFRGEGMELPIVTQTLVWSRDYGLRYLLGGLAAAVPALVLLRVAGGAARWRRAVAALPLVGVLWHWSGVAEFARLLSILTGFGVPLPEALRLAAAGIHDADLSQVGRTLAAGVEQGRTLSELVASSRRLPPTLGPLVRWGEQCGQLGEAFRVASEMFEGRVQMRAALMRSILPTLLFIAVGTFAVLFIVGVYAPISAMIRMLW